LVGTPLKIEFRGGDNPFAGKKNKLSQRQVNKKRRLMKRVKR
jgi:GTP-binding protein